MQAGNESFPAYHFPGKRNNGQKLNGFDSGSYANRRTCRKSGVEKAFTN